MKNLIFTCLVCMTSTAFYSQEKSLSTSNQDTLQRITVEKQTILKTGKPISNQENLKANINKENTSVVSGNKTSNTATPVESKEEITKKIQQIDSHINSINIKTKDILNNPEQKSIAEKEGWFEDMKATKDRLEAKKQNLLILLEN